MSTIQIRRAERKKAKLRLGIAGPSGSGKTMGSLKLAKGLGGRIILIDTERGSGDLYADLYDYDIITLAPPYAPKNYVDAIHAAEEAGYDTIIIDSLSHAWSDEGGLLDQADKLSRVSKNSYTVWADLTPQHRALVGAMLNSPANIIATVRSKQAYELEEYNDRNGNKKQRPVKIGLAPVQREGMEYEFTVFFDVDQAHNTKASKDRTNMFKDEVFILDETIGKRIFDWLNSGKEDYDADKRRIASLLAALGHKPETKEAYAEIVKKLTELELVETNYSEIIARLSVAAREAQEAQKNGNANTNTTDTGADVA